MKGPIFDKGFFDAVFVGFSAIEAFISCEIDSTIFTIDGVRIGIDSVGIFFIEIFDGKGKGIRNEPFKFVEQVFSFFFEKLHQDIK